MRVIAGGLTAETGAAFTPGGKGSAAETYTAEGSLKTDAAVFKRPGVYHYTVTEKANNYEGVTTDTTPTMYMCMCIIEQMDFMWEMLFQLKMAVRQI